MFERFTEKAIKVIMLSQEEARRLEHNVVSDEQILLGLIAEETGVAAQAFKTVGIDLRSARVEVEKVAGRGPGFIAVEFPFAPNAVRSLEVAAAESERLGHSRIDTEHLLLGLIHNPNNERVSRVLIALDVDIESLEQHVVRQIESEGYILARDRKYRPEEPTEYSFSNLGEDSLDLVAGEMSTAEISARLASLLSAWVEPRRSGRIFVDTEFNLPTGDLISIDVSYVVGMVEVIGVPELVAEIRSDVKPLFVLRAKIHLMLTLGTRVGLLIDPEDCTVTVYRPDTQALELDDDPLASELGSEDTLTIPELFPGWELPIAQLWSPV